jgi:leishmanolysin-like peptidase
LDRPIAGHTNICPQAIVNSTKEISALYSTIKHELLHALGFSSRYYTSN